MTQQSFILPLARVSPVRVPRRDLYLGAADSLSLSVTVVDRDSPDAVPITLTGGIGGPALYMVVWPDRRPTGQWDYGWGWCDAYAYNPAAPLWTGVGVIDTTAPGTFAIAWLTATMASWPRRAMYDLQLDWNGAGDTELLATGMIHLAPAVARPTAPGSPAGPPGPPGPVVLLTDTMPAVFTDPEVNAIFIDGVAAP